jgi:hypothetical protein
MAEHNAVVGVFNVHTEAEMSINELHRAGFDMRKLSIMGRGYHPDEHVVGYYSTGERMKVWGKHGAFWGGFWSLLVGSAFFVMPGIGPLMVFGPVVSWIVMALEGSVIIGGLSVFAAALYSIGIPQNSCIIYETALKSDKLLVVVHGTEEEAAKARCILETAGAAEVNVHKGILGLYAN